MLQNESLVMVKGQTWVGMSMGQSVSEMFRYLKDSVCTQSEWITKIRYQATCITYRGRVGTRVRTRFLMGRLQLASHEEGSRKLSDSAAHICIDGTLYWS